MADLSYFTTCFNDLSKVFTFDDPKSKEDTGGYKKGTLKIAVDAKRTNKCWEYKISVPVPAEPNLTNGSIMEEEVVMLPNQEKQKRRIKKKDENNDDEWYMWKIEGQPPEGAKVYDAARVKVYLDADLKALTEVQPTLVAVKGPDGKPTGQQRLQDMTVSQVTKSRILKFCDGYKHTPDMTDTKVHPNNKEEWSAAMYFYPNAERIRTWNDSLNAYTYVSSWAKLVVSPDGSRIVPFYCTQNKKWGRDDDMPGTTSAKDLHNYICQKIGKARGQNDDPINVTWKVFVRKIDADNPEHICYYAIPFGRMLPWPFRVNKMPIAKNNKRKASAETTVPETAELEPKNQKPRSKAAPVVAPSTSNPTDEERLDFLNKQLKKYDLDPVPSTKAVAANKEDKQEEVELTQETIHEEEVHVADANGTPEGLQSSPEDSEEEDG